MSDKNYILKMTFKHILAFFCVSVCSVNLLFSNSEQNTVTSECSVDWTQRVFYSRLSKEISPDISLASSRAGGIKQIAVKTSFLIKDPLLSLYVDSASTLSDMVLHKSVTLEQITNIIDGGNVQPGVFSDDMKKLTVDHKFKLNDIGALMVIHNRPYRPLLPIETTYSRKYTGIIIDARGVLPVQGEFVKSKGYPCFFPKIWDENMELLYERNMTDSKLARKNGITAYNWSDEENLYQDVVGKDPLHISARKIFGTNRTDPVISRKDALKILSVKDNLELLEQGKIVILLDKDTLIHNVAAPVKTKSYYTDYNELEVFHYERNIRDINITDQNDGIHISIEDLNFYADSNELLPEESERIDAVAEKLAEITKDNEYTLVVEGHTASVGKPHGEMNLSYERAEVIVGILEKHGISRDIIEAKGYGGTKPIGDNTTDEGRAKNRRVEIIVQPKVSYILRAQ